MLGSQSHKYICRMRAAAEENGAWRPTAETCPSGTGLGHSLSSVALKQNVHMGGIILQLQQLNGGKSSF